MDKDNNSFDKVVDILLKIRSKISTDTDIGWSRFNNVQQFMNELNDDIHKLKNHDIDALEKIRFDFLPTSTYGEISFSNGWSNEYLKLASEFDDLYDKIKRVK